MSDGEPSSIKRLTRCAARAPALSRKYEDRVEARFDFAVYGTRFAAHVCFKGSYEPLNFPNTAVASASGSLLMRFRKRNCRTSQAA